MRQSVLAIAVLTACPFVPSPFVLGSAGAQLAKEGSPASLEHTLSGEVPLVVMPRPDIEAMKEQDAVAPFGAYRYGAVIPTALGIGSDGRWDQVTSATGDELIVWRLEISSPGAYSLSVLLDEYEIPEGGEVYVYNAERTVVLGAFDASVRQPNGMLTVSPVPGDRLIIEYVQDLTVPAAPRLRVGSVIHDYRDVFQLNAGSAPSLDMAACLIDINCPQGDPYQDIKRSVVGLLRGGFVCSGSILNNTAEDQTPYMLTADHCGSMTNATIMFRYENTTCNGGGANSSRTLAGAVLLARNDPIDSQLYRLNQSPPESYEPYFAGWTRSNSPQGPMISISHPSGLPLKICIDDQDPTIGTNMWSVAWEQGIVEGGSSGSPLFDWRGRVVGPACCVSNFLCGNQSTSYGRFHKFWNQGSLAQWLDPLARGSVGLVGFDPYVAVAVPYNGSGVNANVFTSNEPILGTTWFGTVDTSGHPGASSTALVLYPSSSKGTVLGFGELLVDVSQPLIFRSNAGVSGNLSTHSLAIPNDPMLAGQVGYCQGVILGGGYVEATNAIKLRLN